MHKITTTPASPGLGTALLSKLTAINTAGKPPTPAAPAAVAQVRPFTRREPIQDPDELTNRAALIATAQARDKLVESINSAPPLQLLRGKNQPLAL